MGYAFVGTSGWDYPGWRDDFYAGVPKREWLAHLAARTSSLELNGTFYSLKRPDHFRNIVEQSPAGYRVAVKGSRFITHMKKLAGCEAPLANFYAQGVLALGVKTGPFLWQLPEMVRFDEGRVRAFLTLLPRTLGDAAALAQRHDERLAGRALTTLVAGTADVPVRHAFEPRHASWFCPPCYRLLADRGCALVVADTAGRFPHAVVDTAPFAYVRLHGSTALYASRYDNRELSVWADRVVAWNARGQDAYVYFDNDALGHAPHDAVRLLAAIKKRFPLAVSEARPTG